MKKLNNRGFLFGAVALVPSIFICVAALLSTHALMPSTRAEFQKKKYVKMCRADNPSKTEADCKGELVGMSKEAILDQIRDDDTSFASGNRGFVYGTHN